MRSRVASLLFTIVSMVALAGAGPAPAAAAGPFSDIDGSIFKPDILWAYQSGVTVGCTTNRFCPDAAVTRDQMASFLARMFSLPAANQDFFSDDAGNPHQADINRVARAGIAMGCAAGRFCPTAVVTREQMASFIARARGLSDGAGTNYFWDDDGSAHETDINRAARAGVASGCGGGRFCPGNGVTRGEMTAFLHRIVAPIAPPPVVVAPPPVAGGLGYGSATVGGNGGRTIAVTNLNDSGPGSLRAAVEASGARVVVFAVAGTIQLADDVKVNDPYLTVAGETAPGAGIVVRGGAITVVTHDVIVRHVRLRPGDATSSPTDTDALSINGNDGGVYNVVVDHVTMLWGPDIGGLAILGDVQNVTISNSIMGEGLYLSAHDEGTVENGGHSTGANVTPMDPSNPWPRRITFWRNLFTTSNERMPRVQGGECIDIVNNVIYNWGNGSAHGNPRAANLVNNWYRTGPETERFEVWKPQTSAQAPNLFAGSVYEAGNVADGFAHARGGGNVYASSVLCGGLSVGASATGAAYEAVLGGAGATLPARDATDQRIIANVRDRAGTFVNGVGQPGPNPTWP